MVISLRMTVPLSRRSAIRSDSPPSKRMMATAMETKGNRASSNRSSGSTKPRTGPAKKPQSSSRMDGNSSRHASHYAPISIATIVARPSSSSWLMRFRLVAKWGTASPKAHVLWRRLSYAGQFPPICWRQNSVGWRKQGLFQKRINTPRSSQSRCSKEGLLRGGFRLDSSRRRSNLAPRERG